MFLNIKKKILWVVYDFNQAGGQRYVYEICKALDKTKYQVDVLKLHMLSNDKNWNHEFYYQPTLDLGCDIFFLENLFKGANKHKLHKNIFEKIILKVKATIKPVTGEIKAHQAIYIQAFLSGYDYVNFSGLNVYKSLCIAYGFECKNALIHILTAKFQDDEDIYDSYDKEYPYHFVSSFSNEILSFELAGFKNYKHTYYPLCFETIPYKASVPEEGNQPFVIGVFTRLSKMKPLDPYFYAFKLLLEKGIDVELRIYGAGDPAAEGLLRQLQYLYLSDKVQFCGHLESIPNELKKNEIDLIWFQSNNQMPAGYAALEVAMSGLPQVFWDFSDMGWKHETGEIFPSFINLTEFVNYSGDLLKKRENRVALGLQQKLYVLDNYSVQSNISIIENLFI